jgi:glycosyltransferase involved in cell wall biosynthesis
MHKYFGPRKRPEYIVYNGVDHDQWFRETREKYSDDDMINVVSCANWRRWKRLPEIIRTFNYFRCWKPESTLYIVGEMRRGAKEIIAPNVIYTGTLSEGEMINLYRNMDLYLHLGKNDSCPSTIPEAMAAGIPVITTNACGGATEMAELAGQYIADGDYQSFEPHALYKDEWNYLSDETMHKLALHMKEALWYDEPKFPDELHIRYVAKKYIEIMESVL